MTSKSKPKENQQSRNRDTIRALARLRDAGEQREAIRRIDKLIESQGLQPNFQRLLLHLQADCYLDLKMWKRAVAAYSEMLNEHEEDVAFANRGFAYRELGLFEAAVSDYKCAARLNPKDAVTLRQLAWLQFQLGKIGSSVWYMRRAVKIDPSEARGFLLLGDALAEADKPSAAYDAYEKALTLDPSNARAKQQIKKFFKYFSM